MSIKVLWLAAGLSGVAAIATTASAEGESDGVLVVDITNIQSDEGQIGCSLFSRPDGFPSKRRNAVDQVFVQPKGRKATCTFKNVKPGTYAVSVMHDLDKDGGLDSNIVGRPKEPWGVSNDAPSERFGPPKYDAAKFEYSGKQTKLKVKLRS